MPPRSLPTRQLLEQIRTIERGGTDFAAGADIVHLPTGWEPIDQRLAVSRDGDAGAGEAMTAGGLQRGAIHEWFGVADGPRRSGQTTDPRARRLSRRGWAPPLCMMIHLAWQSLSHEAHRDRRVVWIGRKCWPYGRSMVRPNVNGGTAGRRLLAQSLFVDTDRAPNTNARRDVVAWAIDLALRSPAVTAVIADTSGLDMASTRRLQLAAESGIANQQHGPGGAIALLARPPDDQHHLSAAATRWWVQPQPNPPNRSHPLEGAEQGQGSDSHNDGRSPQHLVQRLMQRWNAAALARAIADVGKPPQPRWRVTLLRCKGAGIGTPGNMPEDQWILEWSNAKSSVVIPANVVNRPGHTTRQTA